jgi:hypothetical protein
MQLTRGKLLKQTDWNEWQASKFLQLDQYYNQGMFGSPHIPTDTDSVFYLVWTYTVKALDASATGRHVPDKHEYLMRHTRTVLTRQAHNCSMPSLPLRTY